MDAGELRVFATVARLGGMGRAAAELNTVQSNVSARIRLLEAQLGVALFERRARGVLLTAAGRRLLPYAERVARLLDEARRAARDDGTPRGSLLLGALETTTGLRLAPMLAAFALAHPAVDLVLRTGTTVELVEEVLAGRLEGALVCGPVHHSALIEETMFREDLALLTAPGIESLEALVRRGDPRIVVLRAGCSYRQRLEMILARHGVPRPRLLEFGTLEAIMGCVAAGLGVTLLPRGLIGPVWREGRVAVLPLPAGEARVETVFLRRREDHLSSALGAFLECARPSLARAAE